MKAKARKIWVTMILKSREEVRFKVKPKDGRFDWGEGKSYLVLQERASMYRGIPSFRYNEGNAEPEDPYHGEVMVTPEDVNEIGGNRYVAQVFAAIKNQLATNLQWVLIVCVAVAAIANWYFGTQTQDEVEALRVQFAAAHPPVPVPTGQRMGVVGG